MLHKFIHSGIKALLLASVLFVFIQCDKNTSEGPIPEISFISISKDTMLQGQGSGDSIYLKFSFVDGDGDIDNTGDMLNIFLVDTRQGVEFAKYAFPKLPEGGESGWVEGEVTVKVYQTCCIIENEIPCAITPQFPSDELTFEIYIVDKAGNESNRVLTDPITLKCD